MRAALRARLTAAIMMEWRAAKGAGRSTDGRAQKTRPRNETEFLDRWGALAEIEGGRCITHTQRLEPMAGRTGGFLGARAAYAAASVRIEYRVGVRLSFSPPLNQ